MTTQTQREKDILAFTEWDEKTEMPTTRFTAWVAALAYCRRTEVEPLRKALEEIMEVGGTYDCERRGCESHPIASKALKSESEGEA